MGWSSWSFLRFGVNAERIETEANALVSTGLVKYGYNHVNIDDNWYLCPGPGGPTVDQYGRWVVDNSEFPSVDGQNGIAAVAALRAPPRAEVRDLRDAGDLQGGRDQAHSDPRHQLHRRSDRHQRRPHNNYNCGGMDRIDYDKPGAQAYVDSVVDELAAWGVDYIKLDGITDRDSGDDQGLVRGDQPLRPADGAGHH